MSAYCGCGRSRGNPCQSGRAPVLAVRAYVKAHASKRAIRVRERAPNIVECVPNSSSREDNVGLVVFRPDLLIGLSEGDVASDVASQINGEHKEHQVSEAAHPNHPEVLRRHA
jgi:hypothetical protein